MKDIRNEAAQKATAKSAKETAERKLKKAKISLDKIADYVPTNIVI